MGTGSRPASTEPNARQQLRPEKPSPGRRLLDGEQFAVFLDRQPVACKGPDRQRLGDHRRPTFKPSVTPRRLLDTPSVLQTNRPPGRSICTPVPYGASCALAATPPVTWMPSGVREDGATPSSSRHG